MRIVIINHPDNAPGDSVTIDMYYAAMIFDEIIDIWKLSEDDALYVDLNCFNRNERIWLMEMHEYPVQSVKEMNRCARVALADFQRGEFDHLLYYDEQVPEVIEYLTDLTDALKRWGYDS